MPEYQLLKLLHLLCFVYWLGADIGVFYSSRYVCDPSLGREARGTAARIMGWVDMIPRYSLILVLPTGLSLAVLSGGYAAPESVLWLLWLAAPAWVLLVWAVTRFARTPRGGRLKQLDYAVRVVVLVAMIGAGLAGLAGGGPIAASWLAAKSLLFGLAVAAGLAIRVLAAPFGPAFAQVMAEGSRPELEQRMQAAMGRAKPMVVVIWVILLAAAWLGLAKPVW